VKCSDCNGTGRDESAEVISCGPKGCIRSTGYDCDRCEGTGVMPAERAGWIIRGRAMIDARQAGGRSLREEAKRRGIDAQILSQMEFGMIEPAEENK